MSILNKLVLVDLPLFTPADLIVDATTLTEKAQKALDEGIKLLPSSQKTWINPAYVVGLGSVLSWVHEPSLGISGPKLRPPLVRLVDSKSITELFLSGASGGIYIAGTPEEVAMTLMGATMDEDDYDDADVAVAILDIPSEVMTAPVCTKCGERPASKDGQRAEDAEARVMEQQVTMDGLERAIEGKDKLLSAYSEQAVDMGAEIEALTAKSRLCCCSPWLGRC